jgi:branched-chain amino acid transport system permease protein
MESRLPIRGVVITLALTAALLGMTQFVFSGGAQGGGTPSAILFLGVVMGLLNGLVAIGLILIYRSQRFINFAQAAMGAAAGVFAYNFSVLNHWPFALSFLGGILVGGLFGFLVEIFIIRRFFNAPRLVLTVISIALIGVFQGAAGYVNGLPIFLNEQDRTVEQLGGSAPFPTPFKNYTFTVGNVPLEFGFQHLLALGLSILAMIAVALYLRYSKAGIAIRATSENAERAPLLGINVGALSRRVWIIAGLLSGLGVILTGMVLERFTVGAAPPQVLFIALAAAVIGRMRSMPGAVAAAVGLTVLRETVRWSYNEQLALVDVGVFVAIGIGLLLQRRMIERSESSETASWAATEEHRPIPKEMLAVPGIRLWKRASVVVGIIALVAYPWLFPTRLVNLGGFLAIVAIVILSQVVLTGWSGQISLGQFAFVAFGAVIGGALTSKMGISFWLALPIVPVIVAGLSVVIGIPALRIKGLYLAVATGALAFAVHSALFEEKYFGWILPERVSRPTFFLLDFEDERSMYYLALAGLLLMVVLVTILRRSRVGRVLIAVRENEVNVQSFGINVVRTRLGAFALSGFLCGFAGMLLAHHQRAVTADSFRPEDSLNIFLFAVVGGVGSVSGAMLGTAYFAVVQLLADAAPWNFITQDIGRLMILYAAPGGLAAIAFGLRDAALRIVAQRRQMVVPSLFADLDPAAMAGRLIPLADPIPNAGLGALPFTQRYKRRSELYGTGGWMSRKAKTTQPSEESTALGAAGDSAEGLQPT